MASAVALQTLNPEGLYDPSENGYAHIVIATGANRLVHIAGQGGENAQGELSADFAEQVQQAYANLQTALQAAQLMPNNVVKLTTYIMDYEPTMLTVLTEHLKDTFGTHLPAQTLVPVPRLALDGMLFEVDAVAVSD